MKYSILIYISLIVRLSIFTHLLATKFSSMNAYSYPLPILLTSSSLLLLLDLLVGLLFIFWILFCCQLFRLQISSPNLQLIVFPFMEFVLHKALNIVKFINILLHEKCFWCLQKLFMRSQEICLLLNVSFSHLGVEFPWILCMVYIFFIYITKGPSSLFFPL